MEKMTLLHEYSEFAVTQTRGPIKPEVIHHAKRAVIDWLASTYPGARCSPATLLVRATKDELGFGRSSLVGCGTTAFPATAAWINGSASHAIEFDDTFREAVYHPGCPVVASALAIAEAQDASGKDFLTAIIVGYEISTRIGAAIQPSHVKYFHPTGTVGCLGAAASAAALMSPTDAVAIRHALATATTFASGLQQAMRSESMTKPLHAGNAASVGVRAAQAAAQGLTGAADVLEGPVGLGAAMASNARWDTATQGLGEIYNIARVTHKVHACCGHQFPSIDAAVLLREQHGFDVADIESVQVVTYQEAVDVTGRFNPQTAYEAKFSLPFVVSHALLHGSVGLNAFEADKVNDPKIRSLMARFSLSVDPAMTAHFPSQRHAQVVIATKDGKQFTQFVKFRRGDPELPLSDEQLNEKFDGLCEPVLGAKRARQLRDLVWRLDSLSIADLKLAHDGVAK
jgi:2-methylcitrate dehydratase PrpD